MSTCENCARLEAQVAAKHDALECAVEYIQIRSVWDEWNFKEAVTKALSSDAGKGWVSTEEHERLLIHACTKASMDANKELLAKVERYEKALRDIAEETQDMGECAWCESVRPNWHYDNCPTGKAQRVLAL